MSWQNKYRPKKPADLELVSVRQQLECLLAKGRIPQVLLFAGPKGTGKTSTARILAAILNSPNNAQLVEKVFFNSSSQNNQSDAKTQSISDKKSTTDDQNSISVNQKSTSDNQKTSTTSQKLAPDKFSDPDLSDPQIAQVFAGNSYLVQEIDAASYNGVDSVRALQEQFYLPPALSKISVYILDEVHMFSTSAFNALLKILEEPPRHCLFILATTELHKIPATIISRCTVIPFRRATKDELITAIKKVADQEKLQVDDQVLCQLAETADGSFRDAVKMLELAADLSSDGHLTTDSIAPLVQTGFTTQFPQLLQLITIEKDASAIMNFFGNLRSQNISETYFYQSWINFLYHQLELTVGINHITSDPQNLEIPLSTQPVIQFLLQQMLDLSSNNSTINRQVLPFLQLELKCLDLVMRSQRKKSPVPSPISDDLSVSQPSTEKKTLPALKQEPAHTQIVDLPTPTDLPESPKITPTTTDFSDHWNLFIQTIQKENLQLAAIFKLAEIIEETTTQLTLCLPSKFHQEQLSLPRHKQLLAQVLITCHLPTKDFLYQLSVNKAQSQSSTTLNENPIELTSENKNNSALEAAVISALG